MQTHLTKDTHLTSHIVLQSISNALIFNAKNEVKMSYKLCLYPRLNYPSNLNNPSNLNRLDIFRQHVDGLQPHIDHYSRC